MKICKERNLLKLGMKILMLFFFNVILYIYNIYSYNIIFEMFLVDRLN